MSEREIQTNREADNILHGYNIRQAKGEQINIER